jgi:hypothetical protein
VNNSETKKDPFEGCDVRMRIYSDGNAPLTPHESVRVLAIFADGDARDQLDWIHDEDSHDTLVRFFAGSIGLMAECPANFIGVEIDHSSIDEIERCWRDLAESGRTDLLGALYAVRRKKSGGGVPAAYAASELEHNERLITLFGGIA